MPQFSKFFRVAVAGDTVDGREITEQDISHMAETYRPELYGARIWMEHFRGLIPGGLFDALGDVVSLKTEQWEGKPALFAQLDVLPPLVEMNQKKQKIYSSIEILPNFRNTGKPYLVGLAVTDSPASAGTEALKFSIGADAILAGPYHEFNLELEPAVPAAQHSVPPPAQQPAASQDYAAQFAAQKADTDALKQSVAGLQNQLTELTQTLASNPASGYQSRQQATGGSNQQLTDC